MEPSRSLRYLRYAAWVCLALALLAAAVECVWKNLFWRGGVPGIPRLFNAVGQVAPPLSGFLALGFVGVLVLWLVRMNLRKPRHAQVAISARILLLALIASFAAMVASVFEEPWTVEESVDVHGETYSLVSQAGLISISYGLVTCDQGGVFCRIVQWFGSQVSIFTPYPYPSKPSLSYVRATDTLYVRTGGKVIGGYKFGPAGGPLVVP